jgi:hypothetical protein
MKDQESTTTTTETPDVECQFCDFRGTFAEGAAHRRQTQHLIRTVTAGDLRREQASAPAPQPELDAGDYLRRLENAFLMAYDLAGIDAEPLPERLPEKYYADGYMAKVRELREVFAIAFEHAREALAGVQGKE